MCDLIDLSRDIIRFVTIDSHFAKAADLRLKPFKFQLNQLEIIFRFLHVLQTFAASLQIIVECVTHFLLLVGSAFVRKFGQALLDAANINLNLIIAGPVQKFRRRVLRIEQP